VPVREQMIKVESYSGYKADERPSRVEFGKRAMEIVKIEDRWYSPGVTYFRVVVEGGDRYVLRHEEAQDVWIMVGYRASASLTQKLCGAYSQVTK
jgi:hypothetical protein